MDAGGFSDNFDGSEFSAHQNVQASSETVNRNGGFDNPCLEVDDKPATLPVTQDEIQIETAPQSNGNLHQTAVKSSLPVLYTTETGGSKVVKEQVIIGGTKGNVIQTQQTCCQNVPERWRDIERQKPLTQKRIMVLKILSIISLLFFFPLGIPAVFFAFRLQRTLNEGIMHGNIDKALRLAKRVERLIIFAGLFTILAAVLVFALVERANMSDKEIKADMRNRIMPG